MDDVAGMLAAARDAYHRRDWAAARERFRAADGLAAADLDALGDAAWWLGEVDEASAALEAASRRHLEEGRPGAAAMAAIGVAVNAFLRGDAVVGSGWLSRAQRLLHDQPEDPAHGYLLYLELEGALGGDDPGRSPNAPGGSGSSAAVTPTPTWPPPPTCSRAGPWSRPAGSPTAWRCWTRPCWPSARASSARSGPATSTAT
jgi:hypothetical protein